MTVGVANLQHFQVRFLFRNIRDIGRNCNTSASHLVINLPACSLLSPLYYLTPRIHRRQIDPSGEPAIAPGLPTGSKSLTLDAECSPSVGAHRHHSAVPDCAIHIHPRPTRARCQADFPFKSLHHRSRSTLSTQSPGREGRKPSPQLSKPKLGPQITTTLTPKPAPESMRRANR